MQRSRLSGKAYPHVQPGKKAVARIKAQTTELTRRALTPMPLSMLMERLNQTLRGWTGYFHYRNSTQVLNMVKWHAEERLRTHMRKRHKIKYRAGGYERFPSRVLYGRYGLFKVPTTAPWKNAHALA